MACANTMSSAELHAKQCGKYGQRLARCLRYRYVHEGWKGTKYDGHEIRDGILYVAEDDDEIVRASKLVWPH